jgi:hypothetical protein
MLQVKWKVSKNRENKGCISHSCMLYVMSTIIY